MQQTAHQATMDFPKLGLVEKLNEVLHWRCDKTRHRPNRLRMTEHHLDNRGQRFHNRHQLRRQLVHPGPNLYWSDFYF